VKGVMSGGDFCGCLLVCRAVCGATSLAREYVVVWGAFGASACRQVHVLAALACSCLVLALVTGPVYSVSLWGLLGAGLAVVEYWLVLVPCSWET